jgi:hypothetical protein
MQSQQMADVDDNDLARATQSLMERLQPYLPTIAAVIGIGLAGLAAWTVVSAQREGERSQAWDAVLAAVSTRDASRLGEVAARYPGSAAAAWSQVLLADNALAEGTRLLFIDKSRGRERLQAAADLYAGVLAQRGIALAGERATFGLARARESLGELDAARKGYEALVTEFPQSPFRSLAEERSAALARPATAGWYDWFSSHAAIPVPPAAPAESPAAGGGPAAAPADGAGPSATPAGT